MRSDTHKEENTDLKTAHFLFFKGSAFSHAAALRVSPRCVIKFSLSSLEKSSNKKTFVSRTLPARVSSIAPKVPDSFWITLKQENNSQTTGWRWTQPAQSSLAVFLTVRLTPHCLPWFSPTLPLTTESCRSPNAKRMRIGLSRYLKQHSWTGTKTISQTGLLCARVYLTVIAHFQHCAQDKGKSLHGGDVTT